MAGGTPDEGEARRGRREPTDADVQREWAQITAGLSDLADLGADDGDGDEASAQQEPDSGGTTVGPESGGAPGRRPGPDPAREGRSPSSPTPGEDPGQGGRPPSSTIFGPPLIGDLPLSTPGAGSAGPRDYDVDEDEDEGYTPPEPPPIGTGDPLPTLAWLMALGGPILTVLLLIVWTTAPGWLYLSAVCASLAGWLVLFWRMPKGRRDSDDDNGAVL